jgi:hypothetical protein
MVTATSVAQTKTNLEVFNKLIDSSVVKMNDSILATEKTISLNYNASDVFAVFRNQVVLDFARLGKTISSTSANIVDYSVEDANVHYGEMYKDGIFGDYFVPRTVKLKGNYSIESGNSVPGKFNLAFVDSVAVDDIVSLQNPAYPFTQDEVPTEPFFSSLFAPVVAIGSAALAVILFFTVRSK